MAHISPLTGLDGAIELVPKLIEDKTSDAGASVNFPLNVPPVNASLVASTIVILAVPSNETPLIVLAVCNLVASAAKVARDAVPESAP